MKGARLAASRLLDLVSILASGCYLAGAADSPQKNVLFRGAKLAKLPRRLSEQLEYTFVITPFLSI